PGSVNCTGPLVFSREGKQAGPSGLEPGQYRCHAEIHFLEGKSPEQANADEQARRWYGNIPSPCLDFQVKAPQPINPVSVKGIDFEVVTGPRWPIPSVDKPTDVRLGLRLTNRTDREQIFNLFDTVNLAFQKPTDPELGIPERLVGDPESRPEP